MIDKIIEYQEIDGNLKNIENELSQSEEKKKASQAKKFLDGVADKISEIENKAGHILELYKQQEETCLKIQEAIQEFTTIVENCDDAQEIEYYQKKLGDYLAKVKSIENDLEKLKDEINDTMNLYKSLKKNKDAAMAQYKEFAPKYNELKQSKSVEMDKIKEKLALMEKDIRPDILELYKSKRKDKIYPIFVKAENNFTSCLCSYCRTGLSMQSVTLLNQDGIIECDNCHRILYKEQ